MKQPDSLKTLTRRALLQSGLGAGALLAQPIAAFATAPPGFDQWRDGFRARALAKGISDATYTRVMGRIEPDMTVFKQMQKQPEFSEQIWQYVNRRVSDWRIIAGKEALKQNEALFARIEKDFGVERGTLLALWAIPSGCRRCGSMSASTMTATARSRRSASPTMRSARPRAISSIAANITAANIGATRFARRAAQRAAAAPMRRGRAPASPAPMARR